MSNKEQQNVDDPLLDLFLELLEDKEEKEILSLVFENLENEQIVEKLINHKKTDKKND